MSSIGFRRADLKSRRRWTYGASSLELGALLGLSVVTARSHELCHSRTFPCALACTCQVTESASICALLRLSVSVMVKRDRRIAKQFTSKRIPRSSRQAIVLAGRSRPDHSRRKNQRWRSPEPAQTILLQRQQPHRLQTALLPIISIPIRSDAFLNLTFPSKR